MPWLAALVCCSAFDLALHDAYGVLHGVPTYRDLQRRVHERRPGALTSTPGRGVRRLVRRPVSRADFLVRPRPEPLPAWHLVGGKDPLDASELTGAEPDDGYPVLLRDWIRRDGLKCLKVKLRGDDAAWDYDRLVKVGRIAVEEGVDWLTADFNCTVARPGLRQRDPRPAAARASAALRDDPLRRAAVPLRPGSAPDRRPQRLGAQAAVHGRERPRLAARPARPRAGLDGRGAEDLQDADRAPC